jgi:hypothetical protein
MKQHLKLALFILLVTATATTADAQNKKHESLREAIFSAGKLRGDAGPSNVVWIKGGAQYSFTKMNEGAQEIWIHDFVSWEE